MTTLLNAPADYAATLIDLFSGDAAYAAKKFAAASQDDPMRFGGRSYAAEVLVVLNAEAARADEEAQAEPYMTEKQSLALDGLKRRTLENFSWPHAAAEYVSCETSQVGQTVYVQLCAKRGRWTLHQAAAIGPRGGVKVICTHKHCF